MARPLPPFRPAPIVPALHSPWTRSRYPDFSPPPPSRVPEPSPHFSKRRGRITSHPPPAACPRSRPVLFCIPGSYLGPGLRWGSMGQRRSEGAGHSPADIGPGPARNRLSGCGGRSPRARAGEKGLARAGGDPAAAARPPPPARSRDWLIVSCAPLCLASPGSPRGACHATGRGRPAQGPLGFSAPLPLHSLRSRISAPARASRSLASASSPCSPLAPPWLASPLPSPPLRPTLSPPLLAFQAPPPRPTPRARPRRAWAGRLSAGRRGWGPHRKPAPRVSSGSPELGPSLPKSPPPPRPNCPGSLQRGPRVPLRLR